MVSITIVQVPSRAGGMKKIQRTLKTLLTELLRMSTELDAVTAKLTELEAGIVAAQAATDIKQEAIAAAIATLKDMIGNQAATPEQLNALTERLTTALDATTALTTDITDTPEG